MGSTRSTKPNGTERRAICSALWFGANSETANFAVGILAVSLYGTSLAGAFTGLALGSVLGYIAISLVSVAGPRFGLPQMVISRRAFGRDGNVLSGDPRVSRGRRLVLDRLHLRRASAGRAAARRLSGRAHDHARRFDRHRGVRLQRDPRVRALRRHCDAGRLRDDRGRRVRARASQRAVRSARAVCGRRRDRRHRVFRCARVLVLDRLDAVRVRLRALPAGASSPRAIGLWASAAAFSHR